MSLGAEAEECVAGIQFSADGSKVIAEGHCTVRRTARFYTLGGDATAARETWFVLHGYGQLAQQFIRYFADLDDGTRFVVAPEALNRFYLVPPGDIPATRRAVGATWMTREDRGLEIADYLGYLDTLYDQLIGNEPRGAPRAVRVLGFSQGAATAARWVARHGRKKFEELILWGGLLPPEPELIDERSPLRGVRLTLVLGAEDQYVGSELLADQSATLDAHAIGHRVHRFPGGHAINRAALAVVAQVPNDPRIPGSDR